MMVMVQSERKLEPIENFHPAYMVILGDGEAEGNTVSLRARSGEQVSIFPLMILLPTLYQR